MTTVKNLSYQDTVFTALSGTPGALQAILRAALVTGAGSMPVMTLTVSGGVATLTYASAHPYATDRVLAIAGTGDAAVDGHRRVLSVTSTSITAAVPGAADGVRTGTLTSALASAGWQELFAGTANMLVARSSAVVSPGGVLRLDDTGTTNARALAYESMGGINAGVGRTPLEAQVAGGLWFPKSGTANATVRPWFIVGDERGFYLALAPQGGDRFTLLYIGERASFAPGDAYAFGITGNESDETASTTPPLGCCGYSARSARAGAYLLRGHLGIGQSIAVQRTGAHHNGTASGGYAGTPGYGWGVYPNGANNGLMTGALEDVSLGMRGLYPGLLHPVQDCGNAFTTGVVIDGTGDYLGRRLMAIRVGPPAAAATVAGTVFLDTTGPWDRS